MTTEQLKRANDIEAEIKKLKSFIFWCGGDYDIDSERAYPFSVVAVKRKWYGAIEEQEYEFPKESTRLSNKIIKAICEEVEILTEELENM